MAGPILFPIALGVAGWLSEGWAGLTVGVAVGLLITVAVMAGAVWWSRTIGSLLEPDDAWANAPRPPGFTAVCEYVYRRAISD